MSRQANAERTESASSGGHRLPSDEDAAHTPRGCGTTSGQTQNTPSPPPAAAAAAAPPCFWQECKERLSLNLLLSTLSTACWALAGSASRLALHRAFLGIPFFSTYEFFGPNSIGSFAMGLFTSGLPPEKDVPVLHGALRVGFCGSLTTFSSWVVDVVNKRTAAQAFEELISGLTIPFVFYLWGNDAAMGARGLIVKLRGRCAKKNSLHDGHAESATTDELVKHPEVAATAAARKANRYRVVQYVWVAFSCAAAIAIPIGVGIRISQGHIRMVSSADIKAVVVAPAGAVVRLLLSTFLNKRAQWRDFPVGTLAANVLGVLLAVSIDTSTHRWPAREWPWIATNGICGALSTVSSFVSDVCGLYTAGRMLMCYAYALVTVVLTLTIGAIGRRRTFG